MKSGKVENPNKEQFKDENIRSVETHVRMVNNELDRLGSSVRLELSIKTLDENAITLTDINGHPHIIPVNEIICITKENPYTVIKSPNMKKYGKLFFKDSLESIASRIQGLPLLAVNRSYIIQIFCVDYRDSRSLYIGELCIGFRGKMYELCLQLFKTKKQGGGITNPQILYANPQIWG
jgi:hypothetical protein